MEAQVAAGESPAPLHMEARAAAEQRGAPLRTHSFLFGCVLSATQRKVSFPGGGDDLREQLTLCTVSLGLGARDELHVLEVEGETQEGTIRVPVATLHPSLLTSVYLGGLELTPPVTFWLTAGTGPLYISGQHLVAITESEAATKAAVKRETEREAEQRRVRLKMEYLGVALPPSLSYDQDWPRFSFKNPHVAIERIKQKLVSLSLEPGCIPKSKSKFQKFARCMFSAHGQTTDDLWLFVVSEKLNKLPATSKGRYCRSNNLAQPLQTPNLPESGCGALNELARALRNPHVPGSGSFQSNARVWPLQNPHLPGSASFQDNARVWPLQNPHLPGRGSFESNARAWPLPKSHLTIQEMKEQLFFLSSGARFPKTWSMFRKYARFMFHASGQTAQDLWDFVLSEKLN